MADSPIIALAGATGDLGGRILTALLARGATVRALVRPGEREVQRLEALGATVAEADPSNVDAMADAVSGAACVVSALNGLWDVIVERQGVLLDAAVQAGVPRFVPSDFSEDYTQTRPGDNRNLDLRRAFKAILDRAPVRAMSVLNGAFMDMLGSEMPVIQPRIRRVLYWGSADQPLDFTTKDDTAAYTAEVALDDDAPRILRIAGETLSARGLAEAMTAVTGERYKVQSVGSLGVLSTMIRTAQLVAPQAEAPFPVWQGMQYMRDMFSGRGTLHGLDTDRYPDLSWTSVRALLAERGVGA